MKILIYSAVNPFLWVLSLWRWILCYSFFSAYGPLTNPLFTEYAFLSPLSRKILSVQEVFTNIATYYVKLFKTSKQKRLLLLIYIHTKDNIMFIYNISIQKLWRTNEPIRRMDLVDRYIVLNLVRHRLSETSRKSLFA